MENEIFKGAVANDKTGTTARQAADIINGNFNLLDGKITALQSPDGVLKSGAVVITGLNGAIAATAFAWRVGGVSYLSPAAFNFTLDAAAAANYRVDALLGNSSGTYNIFKGTESTTVAVPPTVFPVGTVLLGYVSLFGTTVTDIFAQNQLANETYIAKNELSSRKLFGTGNRASFSINSEAATFRIMEAISIASVQVAENLKKYIYSGKDHYVRNETGADLVVKHNAGTGNYKYFFPAGTDLVLKNNEIVQFKFRFTADNAGFLDYVGADAVSTGGAASTQPYTTFKRIQKGFGNINLSVDEAGDIFCGWSNDGTMRYPEAEWLGGALNNSDNFKPLITVIIEN